MAWERGGREKSKDPGPSASAGRKAHVFHVDDDDHKRKGMGGSSVDDLPWQVKAGKVKTRAMGGGLSKAMCPVGLANTAQDGVRRRQRGRLNTKSRAGRQT
jgi:hypothetical protein